MLHAWVEFNNAIPANQLAAIMVAVFHFSIIREDAAALEENREPSLQSAA
jgi:hypothetical protein